MYLEKLEIQGFKSFANPVTLKFNRELTAIVGPNGSGKSNVADSIRWVLGEQSLKLLRGKKSEDVIFSGSDQKTRLGMAEVSMYLNNEDQKAQIDFREIVISRRVYRSGESEYLINKNKVRLVDIQLLLAKANFAQKTYSVIGQGMIDFILTASPQERKEFFDEATGIRQYQIKKEQAVNKLINTRNNLDQSQNILKEIEPRYRSLNRQVKRLEKRNEFEKKLRDLQKLYFSKMLNNFTQELNGKQQELKKEEAARQDVINTIDELNKNIETQHQASGREKNFDSLQQELSTLNFKKNQLLKEKALFEGSSNLDLMKEGKINQVWLEKKLPEQEEKIIEIKKQIENLESDYKIKEDTLKNKINRLNDLLTELAKIEEKILKTGKPEKNEEEILEALDRIYREQSGFFDLLARVDTVDDIAEFKKSAKEIQKRIEKIYQQVAEIRDKGSDKVRLLQQKVSELKNSQELLNKEISQQKIALSIIEERISLFQESQKEAEVEKQKINDLLNGLSGQDTQNRSDKIKEIDEQLKEQQEKITQVEEKIQGFNQSEDKKKAELFALQEKMSQNQSFLNKRSESVNALQIEIAKIEAHLEDLNKKIKEDWPGDFQPLKEGYEVDLDSAGKEIERLKNQLNLIGGLDEGIKEEHEEVSSRYEFLNKEITDLEEAFAGLEKVIHELDGRIKNIFSENFEKINKDFSEYFKILFNGGRAKLVLIKEVKKEKKVEIPLPEDGSEDDIDNKEKKDDWLKKIIGRDTSANIEIQATPPGKKLSSINMLSGGEKALTSIALICAIINNNPSPFVVLDEVDAALDEANSIRFTRIIDELSEKTQFVCITHNRATIQKAAILYGVTMGADSVSKLLSLNLKEADKYIKD